MQEITGAKPVRDATFRPASIKVMQRSFKPLNGERYPGGPPVLSRVFAKAHCCIRHGHFAVMESGFVFITNRHEMIDGRVPYNRDASPTSRPRGWNDQTVAVRRGHPFGWNASICMTDSCHAPHISAETNASLPFLSIDEQFLTILSGASWHNQERAGL